MSGELPQCLGNFNKNLEVLNLRRNGFHGSIPQIFGSGTKLRTLDVSSNQLHGQLPRSLANCTKLEVLDLGNNMMDDIFPFWLETLPVLKVLVLRSNRFHGPIGQPGTTTAFANLSIVDLSFNGLTGNLPSEYFKSWKSMMVVDEEMFQPVYMSIFTCGDSYYFDTVMIRSKGLDMDLARILSVFKAVDCSNNMFVGEISDSIGNLTSLRVLNLSGNGLTGHLPSSLGNLREIESLDLSKNMLSGQIPEQLTSLTFLAVFDVSQNNLTGPIPQGAQFQTFPSTSYEGNTDLCGLRLSTTCENVEVAPPSSSPSQESYNSELIMDGFSWQ